MPAGENHPLHQALCRRRAFVCCFIIWCLGCAGLLAQDDLRPLVDGLARLPSVSLRYAVHYTSGSGARPSTTDYEFCHSAGLFYIKRYNHSSTLPPYNPALLSEWLAYDGEVFYIHHASGRILVMGSDATAPQFRSFVQSLFSFHPWFCPWYHAFYLGGTELFCLPGIASVESLFRAAPDLELTKAAPPGLMRLHKDGGRVLTTMNVVAHHPEAVLTEIPSEKKQSLLEVMQWSQPSPQDGMANFIFSLHIRRSMLLLEGKASFVNFEIVVDPATVRPAAPMSAEAFTIPATIAKRIVNLDTHTSMEIK